MIPLPLRAIKGERERRTGAEIGTLTPISVSGAAPEGTPIPGYPGIKWSPTHPPCFIDISKMHRIFDMSSPRGEETGHLLPHRRGMDSGSGAGMMEGIFSFGVSFFILPGGRG